MTSDQFARVEALFDGACAQPAALQGAWLREQCPDDPEVRQKVEAMLAQDARSRVSLDSPAFGAGFHVGDVSGVEQRLRAEIEADGRYRIQSLLGEGGFGSVYRAEQMHPVRRDVALKIVKVGMDTARVLVRFEAECQTLALMNHPGIAKVLDAGATASGRSFFVMELVEGRPITVYCDDEQLDTVARLQLFVRVCEAVRHAHQKGVLHRDLKPSNVLVAERDGQPVPIVIDFGIARAMDDAAPVGSLVTEQGQFLGTPEYMSPEQAVGERDIDTRTDIYALGVLLYELLTGTTPLTRTSSDAAGLLEFQRVIREREPPKPSTRCKTLGPERVSVARRRRTDPATLTRTLRGDLDWIVLKALEKDRAMRYASVDALAADVGRYLADEPIAARPPSKSYQFRKFARRNKGPLAAGIAIFFLLVGGVIGTAIGMIRARHEAGVARKESAIAQAVSEFLNHDLLTAVESQSRGHDVTMRQILDAAAQRLDGRFDDRPEIELALRSSLGRAYRYLGEFALARKHFERGIELSRRPGVSAPKYSIDAKLGLANVDNALGDYAAAESLLREALDEAIRFEGERGGYPLLIMNSLAQTLRRLDRPGDAEAVYQRVIELRRSMPDSTDNQKELLTVMSNLGTLYFMADRYADAAPILSEVRERAEKMLGLEHEVTMKTTYDLAGLLRRLGRLGESEALIVPLKERMERVLGENHPLVCFVRNELAALRQDQGRLEEALALRSQAVAGLERAFGREHPESQYSIRQLVRLLEQMNRPDDAAEQRAKLTTQPATTTPTTPRATATRVPAALTPPDRH